MDPNLQNDNKSCTSELSETYKVPDISRAQPPVINQGEQRAVDTGTSSCFLYEQDCDRYFGEISPSDISRYTDSLEMQESVVRMHNSRSDRGAKTYFEMTKEFYADRFWFTKR